MIFMLLVVSAILVTSLFVALVLSSRSLIARATALILALGLAAFYAFGFLASFEPSDSPRWPWQLAYGVLTICLLVTALRLLCRSWRLDKPTS
jgi:hypothetical protein